MQDGANNGADSVSSITALSKEIDEDRFAQRDAKEARSHFRKSRDLPLPCHGNTFVVKRRGRGTVGRKNRDGRRASCKRKTESRVSRSVAILSV